MGWYFENLIIGLYILNILKTNSCKYDVIYHAIHKLIFLCIIVGPKCKLARSWPQQPFVRQQGNRVAHALARWAINSPSLTVWMEEVPPNISSVVQADLATNTQ